MDDFDFKKFMKTQCDEINKHKWIESEKKGYDLGNIACKDWIDKYSKQFKEWALTQPYFYKDM